MNTEEFWGNAVRNELGCLVIKGRTPNNQGYLILSVNGKLSQAHRHAYELAIGAIPDGLMIDHVCHSKAVQERTCLGGVECPHRACIDPNHLEPVSHQENVDRGARSNSDYCPNGHEYTIENTAYRPDGSRRCRICRKVWDDRRYEGSKPNQTRGNPASGYRGVRSRGNSHAARIVIQGNSYTIGSFNTPEEAAMAVDDCAVLLHGTEALLNFPNRLAGSGEPLPNGVRKTSRQPRNRSYTNKTGFRGVTQIENGRFNARVNFEGATNSLGTYDTAEEAARVRDEAAIHIQGEVAVLNFLTKEDV